MVLEATFEEVGGSFLNKFRQAAPKSFYNQILMFSLSGAVRSSN